VVELVALDDVTEGYLALTARYVEDAGALAGNTFTNLGSWRDEDIERFIEELSVPLTGIKRQTSNAVVAYHEKMAGLAEKAFKAPNLADLDLSTAALRNGANVRDVYTRPFVQMRMALANGDQFTDALKTGSQTATSLARTEVQLSKRKASLFARSANDNIVGYLRTLTGSENCALCYVASTQRYRRGELMPIHPGCDCGEMPIYGDSDPGQVIDQQLLDKSHQAVEDRFGFSSATGRDAIDYRKIAIKDHGELGPMLTVKGHKFVGPNNLNLIGKAMPKPPALPPVTDRVSKIRERADRIDGATIQADIRQDFLDPKNPTVRTNRKNVTFVQASDRAEKYLDEVLEVGKDVDDELSRRIKQRIDDLDLPVVDVKAVEAQKNVIKQQIDQKTAEIIGVKETIQEAVLAQAASTGVSGQALLSFRYSRDFNRIVENRLEKQQPTIARLTAQKQGLQDEFFALQNQLDDVIAPGSKRFDAIMAEEAANLIAEIRGTSTKAPNLVGPQAMQDLTQKALDLYPAEWVDTFAEQFSTVRVALVKRGSWLNSRDGTARLAISTRKPRIADQDAGFATAVHEVGHGMEDVIPGVKQMEYVYWQRRAKSDNNKIQGIFSPRSTSEFGNKDDWREAYTGKSYGLGANDNYEIFTTGVESLLGGGGHFGDSTKGLTVDEDFRRFILGVLIGL
jgi:hypothetical protein